MYASAHLECYRSSVLRLKPAQAAITPARVRLAVKPPPVRRPLAAIGTNALTRRLNRPRTPVRPVCPNRHGRRYVCAQRFGLQAVLWRILHSLIPPPFDFSLFACPPILLGLICDIT